MHLCKTFEQISQISARLDIILLLANCYRSIMALTPEDLLPAVYLSVNKIAPAHEGLELGVGDALLIKCIADSSGKTDKHVKQLYDKEGDLGAVAQSSKATQKACLTHVPGCVVASLPAARLPLAFESGCDAGKGAAPSSHIPLSTGVGTRAVYLQKEIIFGSLSGTG